MMRTEYTKSEKSQPLLSNYGKINHKIINLLKIIAFISRDYGYCFAYNDKLCELLKISESTLKRYLSRLVKAGFIVKDIKRKRAYWRRMYVTKSANKFLSQNDPNTYTKYNNIITTEQSGTGEPIEGAALLDSFSVSDFSSAEIGKEELKLIQTRNNLLKLEKEYTQLCSESNLQGAKRQFYDDFCKFSAKFGSLEYEIRHLTAQIGKLRRKQFDEFMMKKLSNSPAHVKKLLLLCKHKCLNFTEILTQVVNSLDHGALNVCKSTGKKMNTSHGFNIAMKLLRENRWRTPVCVLF